MTKKTRPSFKTLMISLIILSPFALICSVSIAEPIIIGDLCKTPPFAQFQRQTQILSLEILNVFLHLKFSPSLNLNKIEHFSKVSIDHTCTDITQIPDYWLEKAKELTIHYAHTSHGSQINSGILNLESQDSKYSIAIRTSSSAGLPPVEDPPALRMYDGNPPETYISPDDYWDGDGGKDRTRAVADTGGYDFSMWSWCGQVSGASESYIQNYLNTLNQFKNEYPDMRFIYMTGHLDGTRSTGNLHVRNEQIRNYCIANNKVLFDFADIERYDPDGADYLDLGANDNCDYNSGNWADEWCAAHPGSDLCASCSCAHSKPLNCNMKGRAFWWMMARLAGWNPGTSRLDIDRKTKEFKTGEVTEQEVKDKINQYMETP